MNAVAESTHATGQLSSGYRRLRIASETFDKIPAELTDEQLREVNRIATNEAQIENLVLASKEATQVVIPESQIDIAQEQIEGRFDEPEAFENALLDMGMSLEDLRQELERGLRVDAVLELVASRAVSVSETDAKLYYFMHQDRFARPERRKARHILLTVNEDMAGSSEAEVRARAEAIAERLQRRPDRFGEQALKHSECPTSLNEGVLGMVPRGVLYAELDAALFAMEAGTVSMPVASELGWHVLMCEQIEEADIMPVHEALPGLIEKLQQQQGRRAQRQWVAERMKAQREENAL